MQIHTTIVLRTFILFCFYFGFSESRRDENNLKASSSSAPSSHARGESRRGRICRAQRKVSSCTCALSFNVYLHVFELVQFVQSETTPLRAYFSPVRIQETNISFFIRFFSRRFITPSRVQIYLEIFCGDGHVWKLRCVTCASECDNLKWSNYHQVHFQYFEGLVCFLRDEAFALVGGR